MSRFDRQLIRFDWEKRIGWKFAAFEREFFVSSNKIDDCREISDTRCNC